MFLYNCLHTCRFAYMCALFTASCLWYPVAHRQCSLRRVRVGTGCVGLQLAHTSPNMPYSLPQQIIVSLDSHNQCGCFNLSIRGLISAVYSYACGLCPFSWHSANPAVHSHISKLPRLRMWHCVVCVWLKTSHLLVWIAICHVGLHIHTSIHT